MSKINTKLNLNKTPQLVENNSLVMAKNIRLLDDGTIGPDTSLDEVKTVIGEYEEEITPVDIITPVTYKYYTILDYEATMNYDEGTTPVLPNSAYNFHKDDDNDINKYYKYCDKDIYYNILEKENHSLCIYSIIANQGNIKLGKSGVNLVYGEIVYNEELHPVLIDSSTIENLPQFRECLVICINKSDTHNGISYFYTTAPSNRIGSNIVYRGNTYKIYNPLYVETKTIDVIHPGAPQVNGNYKDLKYVSQIVGFNNKIYFFREAIKNNSIDEFADVGLISDNYTGNERIRIFEYDEDSKSFTMIKCGWRYSGGKINGCVNINETGETILTICEYGVENKLIPIKHINLNNCSEDDDETTYTQSPNIPITNLLYHGTYAQKIPNGVYQFFIRYEIRDLFYTNWFPCSTPLFTATKLKTDTIQGSISYVDNHSDSNNSFILEVQHLYNDYTKNYKRFQIGFILSNDNGIFARSWKHFSVENSNNTLIYFDYDTNYIKDINIDDLLKVNYNIYNVNNITSFKNRLYISNYIESDFNKEDVSLSDFAESIDIKLKTKKFILEDEYSINGYPVITETIDTVDFVTSYINSDITKDIKETYGDKNWCKIETKFTDITDGSFNINLREVNGSSYNYSVVPISVESAINNILIYSIYTIVYEGDNPIKIPFIVDNSDRINYNEPPSDILKIPITGSIGETYDKRISLLNRYATKRITDYVQNKVIGINKTDNKYYVKYTNNNVEKIASVDKIYYVAAIYGYNKRIGENERGDIIQPVNKTKYECEISVESLFDLKETNTIKVGESQTLLPFTNYDFYCHYISKSGIVTNGYKIKTLKIKHWGIINPPDTPTGRTGDYYVKNKPSDNDVLTGDVLSGLVTYEQIVPEGVTPEIVTETIAATELPANYVVYPTFETNKTIKLPDDCVGYFITMYKHKNDVCELFNKHIVNSEYRFDCIESDTSLYKILDNIVIKNWKGELIVSDAKYAPSGVTETNQLNKFGDVGCIYFTPETAISDDRVWIIGNDYANEDIKQLIKVTPIIYKNNSYTSYDNQFLQGFYCLIHKLEHQDPSNRTYVSGQDIYTLTTLNGSIKLTLQEGEKTILYSNRFSIHSNYNLNYLSTTQDLNPKLRNYNKVHVARKLSDPQPGVLELVESKEEGDIQMIFSVDSLISSYILTLDSTFKDFTKKVYYPIDDKKLIKFNNTVRSSSIDSDESYRYIFRFEAEDYYNIPVNRGIITNLISVLNEVYVHCEHSLFKFTDKSLMKVGDNLYTNGKGIGVEEGDIFDTGVIEVFDAQYGYAGLKDRRHSLVTYNSYVFYDSVAKTIYGFEGNQQIANISASIKKLINFVNPIDVLFVGDELHNRFFVNLINNNGNVCLSFNFNNKGFISIHDFNFEIGFHSRKHTYFVNSNFQNELKTGYSIYRITESILNNYTAYRNCYKQSLIQINDCDNVVLNEYNSANSCVDVIVNTEYEKIKVLNYISWICSKIIEYGNNNNYVAEETLNRKYPCDKLRIYSDSTSTDLFELVDSNNNAKISNENRNIDNSGNIYPNPNSWQYPQYNCGVWSMNYFRDKLNTGDVFNYKNSANKITGGEGHSKTTDLTPKEQRELLTQENSLIYGKYFIVRFIFSNKNFKLENVILRMNDYEKTI